MAFISVAVQARWQHNTFYADIDATARTQRRFNQPIGWRTSELGRGFCGYFQQPVLLESTENNQKKNYNAGTDENWVMRTPFPPAIKIFITTKLKEAENPISCITKWGRLIF